MVIKLYESYINIYSSFLGRIRPRQLPRVFCVVACCAVGGRLLSVKLIRFGLFLVNLGRFLVFLWLTTAAGILVAKNLRSMVDKFFHQFFITMLYSIFQHFGVTQYFGGLKSKK